MIYYAYVTIQNRTVNEAFFELMSIKDVKYEKVCVC